MRKFNNLPAEIQERMLQEQERQGKPRNAAVFEVNTAAPAREGGFAWKESVEGSQFWCEVLYHGVLAVFYEKYPKLPPVTATNNN